MITTIHHIEEVAPNFKTFWLKPERPLQYIAGQYVQITLPHELADNRSIQRWFTLSSSPTEQLLAITTKFPSTPTQISSFKKSLSQLTPGDHLLMSEPMGDFVLPIDTSIPLLFIAGGAGITPYRSIIKSLIDNGEKRSIELIYAAHSLKDIAFKDLLEGYCSKFIIVLSSSDSNWQGNSGTMTAEKVFELSPATLNSFIYISGPEFMTESLVNGFGESGIENSRLITDYFPGYEVI